MKRQSAITSTVKYGKKLFHAGMAGLRTGNESVPDGELSPFLAESAREALRIGAAGACVGFLGSSLMHRRSRLPGIVACGALGFCAGFAWNTRDVRAKLTQSMFREIANARDEHWLEMHPIDYA